MDYVKGFSKNAQSIVEEIKTAGEGDSVRWKELSRQAYLDYRKGIISEKEYGYIHALLMELAYPR